MIEVSDRGRARVDPLRRLLQPPDAPEARRGRAAPQRGSRRARRHGRRRAAARCCRRWPSSRSALERSLCVRDTSRRCKRRDDGDPAHARSPSIVRCTSTTTPTAAINARERTIDPGRFFSDEGQWYVAGLLPPRAAPIAFSASTASARQRCSTRVFDRPTDPPGLQLLDPAAGLPRVTLDVSPGARWVLDQYPHDESEPLDDGWTRLTLPVAARAVDRTSARTARARSPCRRCAGRPRDCRAKRCCGTYPRSIRQMTRGRTSRQDQSTKVARERHSP